MSRPESAPRRRTAAAELPPIQQIEWNLTRDSVFADSRSMIAGVNAIFASAARTLLTRSDEHGSSLASQAVEDTVLRRRMEVLLIGCQPRSSSISGAMDCFIRPDVKVPPSPHSRSSDPRFFNVISSVDRTIRVLVDPDSEDAWITSFTELFHKELTDEGSRYSLVAAGESDATVIRAAVDLLDRVLPEISSSVLSHVSFIGMVRGPGAFESASDRKIPRAIFVNGTALGDIARTAEAILHEAVHQKFYDLQLIMPVFRSEYLPENGPFVRPSWHKNDTWQYDRALTAAHVYVHLAAFCAALLLYPAMQARRTQVINGRDRTIERALFLLAAVLDTPSELTYEGQTFVGWLSDQLNLIRAANSETR